MRIRTLTFVLSLMICMPVMASSPTSLIGDPPQRVQKTVKDKQKEHDRRQGESQSQPQSQPARSPDKPNRRAVTQPDKDGKQKKKPDNRY